MANTILSNPFFLEIILPFVLVFVLIFAILQKTKILGDGKKQIDVMIALVIGLIVVSVGYATGVILMLMPFLAVSAVIILVFMILYGMAFEPGKFEIHNNIKMAIGILASIAVVIAVMIFTGVWSYLWKLYNSPSSSVWIMNGFFVLIIIVAIAAVLWGNSGKSSKA